MGQAEEDQNISLAEWGGELTGFLERSENELLMSAVFTPTRHKLSVDDYHKLGEAGILDEDSRVELIEGELIDRAPIGASHMMAVNRLNRLLVRAVGDLGLVSIQNPVTLPPPFRASAGHRCPQSADGQPGCELARDRRTYCC